MTDTQLYLAVFVPIVTSLSFNGLIYLVLLHSIKAQGDSLRSELGARFDAAHAELLRVEGVLDARLKHLEENRR